MGFPLQSVLYRHVPDDAVLIDTGHLDGKPGKEIYYTASKRALYSVLTGEDPPYSKEELIEERTFLKNSSAGTLTRVDFVRDWYGDGQDEALAFGSEHAIFHKRKQGDELARWSEINLGPHSYIMGEPPSFSPDRNFMLRQ